MDKQNNIKIENTKAEEINSISDEQNEIKSFSNHSANLIEDWKDDEYATCKESLQVKKIKKY